MIESILIALAALAGAAGVALLALAAHAAPGSGLDSAGSLLLFHAAATLGALSAIAHGFVGRRFGLAAVVLFLGGAALFAIEVALHALAGRQPFPMAAPIGGSLTILGWLVLCLAAAAATRRR